MLAAIFTNGKLSKGEQILLYRATIRKSKDRILHAFPTKELQTAFPSGAGKDQELEELVDFIADRLQEARNVPRQHEQSLQGLVGSSNGASIQNMDAEWEGELVKILSQIDCETSAGARLVHLFRESRRIDEVMRRSLAEEFERRRDDLEQQLENARMRNQELDAEIWCQKQTSDSLQAKLKQQEENNERARSMQATETAVKIQQMKTRYEDSVSRMETEHKMHINSTQNQHELRVAELIKEHEGKMADERRSSTNRLQMSERKLNDLRKEYEERLSKEQEEHSTRIEDMERSHSRVAEKLRNDVASMNKIVFARDKFTPMPDRDITAKFQALASDVKHLSMRRWRAQQSRFSDVALRGITPNSDLMRRDLLQDALWWTLFDHVFASPFRMFGDQGVALERQWIEAFGEGRSDSVDSSMGDLCLSPSGEPMGDDLYAWPSPSVKSEQWRYETVKYCHAALKEPASELDARARVKTGFKETRETLITALEEMIRDMAQFEGSLHVDIEKLVKKAFNLWLEFGGQRCRLIVSMPAPRTEINDKLDVAEKSGLILTLTPEIVRYGNGEGLDLEDSEIIAGCSEETQKYARKRT